MKAKPLPSGLLTKTTDKKTIYRVIDANLNRLREGLRVCEDTARFILSDESLAKRIKRLRHYASSAISGSKQDLKNIVKYRDSDADFGKSPQALEKKRKNISDVFIANFQRAKEAARVLEEFTKLINAKISDRFKKIRFRLYSLEKETLKKF